MLTSPYLSDLLQSTASPPDASSDFGSALSAVRMAEADLRFAVEVLEASMGANDRSEALHMRDKAMRELIHALQRMQKALEGAP